MWNGQSLRGHRQLLMLTQKLARERYTIRLQLVATSNNQKELPIAIGILCYVSHAWLKNRYIVKANT